MWTLGLRGMALAVPAEVILLWITTSLGMAFSAVVIMLAPEVFASNNYLGWGSSGGVNLCSSFALTYYLCWGTANGLP